MVRQVKRVLSQLLPLIASLMAVMLPNLGAARQTTPPERLSESQLRAFLLSLMNNPAKLVAFQENPDAVLLESKLSPEEKRILKNRDYKKMRELLAQGKPLPPLVVRPIPNPDTDSPPKPGPSPAPDPSPQPEPSPNGQTKSPN
ncbi:MAG: hypothetical protein F9K29_24155 [Hyphomicrobiaceae bacterium]|nr:MAG: hypothetical protein F9K29_24155 [Hyphomicrobiaceae bacterium]